MSTENAADPLTVSCANLPSVPDVPRLRLCIGCHAVYATIGCPRCACRLSLPFEDARPHPALRLEPTPAVNRPCPVGISGLVAADAR